MVFLNSLSTMPFDVLVLITHYLSVADLCTLERVSWIGSIYFPYTLTRSFDSLTFTPSMSLLQVSLGMSRKMSEVSIWSSVLQDIWAAKPRLFGQISVRCL
jgi:hypothetical protein